MPQEQATGDEPMQCGLIGVTVIFTGGCGKGLMTEDGVTCGEVGLGVGKNSSTCHFISAG
jgi:hypothetical protein